MMKSTKPIRKKTNIPIPEPRHRVGPKGVSSGISFRNLPPPSLDEIKKICEHYQEKCSGTYESLASRYVYQMATEIVDLVDFMTGDTSSSEVSPSYSHTRVEKENTRRTRYELKKNHSIPGLGGFKENPISSSRKSPIFSRNSSSLSSKSNRDSKLKERQPRHIATEKERKRWRKEFQAIHPGIIAVPEKMTRRSNRGFDRSNIRYEETMSLSTSSFSDEESGRMHFMPPPKKKHSIKTKEWEYENDGLYKWMIKEGIKADGLDSCKHDEVLQWLKNEMDRSKYLMKQSKRMHEKELNTAKKELEKVKKAAKVIIRVMRKTGEDKVAKLKANVQSERTQRVESQKMVQNLIKSQSNHLDQLKQVNSLPGRFCLRESRSMDHICDLMEETDLNSVLDELAEDAFQQSCCS